MQLSKLANLQIGVLKTREATYEKTDFEYHMIEIKNIVNSKLKLDNLSKVYLKNDINENYLVKKGDIIIKMFHPISVIYVHDIIEKTIVDSKFTIVSAKKDVDSKILYFLLKNNISLLEKFQSGQVIKILNVNHLKNMELNYRQDKKILLSSQINLKFEKLNELLFQKQKIIEKISKYYRGKYGK